MQITVVVKKFCSFSKIRIKLARYKYFLMFYIFITKFSFWMISTEREKEKKKLVSSCGAAKFKRKMSYHIFNVYLSQHKYQIKLEIR